MKSPDTHVVLVRPVATNKWKPLAYAKSAEAAIALAQKPRKSLSHGDLILAIDIAEVSAMPEHGKCLYFVNKAGVVTKAPGVHNLLGQSTWLLSWEGPDANAYAMLRLCADVDRKLLVTTACAIARVVLQYVPAGENKPRIAIEVAEAWLDGKATIDQVKKAGDDARPIYGPTDATSYAYSATADASVATYTTYPASYASAVARNAAEAMPGEYLCNLRQLSHIVRQHIQLHIALESQA